MNRNPSLWIVQLYMLGLRKIVFVGNLSAFFKDSPGDPLPRDLWKRVKWYKNRFLAIYRLYRLMSWYDDEKEREKGKKVS